MTNSVAWSWRHAILKSNLPPTTRHVLLTVSCFMNEVGEGCYPTTKTLSAASGLSERAVCTHLEKAQERGWIVSQNMGFRGQKWKRNEYRAVWPKGTEPDAKALNLMHEGTEPDDKKALNDVQQYKNSPVYTSNKHIENESNKNGTRFETSFGDIQTAPEEWANWAASDLGFSQRDIDETFERFADYWRAVSGRHGIKRNWLSTWRNWCREDVKKGRISGRKERGGVASVFRDVVDSKYGGGKGAGGERWDESACDAEPNLF